VGGVLLEPGVVGRHVSLTPVGLQAGSGLGPGDEVGLQLRRDDSGPSSLMPRGQSRQAQPLEPDFPRRHHMLAFSAYFGGISRWEALAPSISTTGARRASTLRPLKCVRVGEVAPAPDRQKGLW
jgi:hypothetical protein